jgi:hypothetical protein
VKLLCVVCLFHGNEVKAKTLVKGYAICQDHLSLTEDFYRVWEQMQDPHHQGKTKRAHI